MYTDFYSDRKWIADEYAQAQWDESSGLAPEQISEMIRAFFDAHPEMSRPVQTAHAYRILLENAQLGINPHSMFPDKLRHGGTYVRDASPSVLEYIMRERYDQTFERNCHSIWAQRKMLKYAGLAVPDTDVWHTVVDWTEVLRLGLPGLLERGRTERQKKLDQGQLTQEQSEFYEAHEIAFSAMVHYVHRLKAASEAQGLTRYVRALEHLLVSPPETLYQVLCLCHIVLNVEELGRERCRSYGPIDEMYTPYYVSDLANGIETPDSVREMLRYFLQKIAAEKRYADQPICIGKAWESDDCPAAELTTILLEVYEELGIHNPKIHVRCKKNMSDRLLTQLTRMIRSGSSSMVLVNDEAVFAGYEKIGIPREVADKYVPLGCYESTIMGLEDSRICASWINLIKACEYTITGGYDLQNRLYVGQHTPEPKSWDEFLQTYYSYLREHCQMVMNNVDVQALYAYEANPSPYFSGTIRSCMESGKDVFNCGMTYRNQSVKFFAIASTVDSLLAVKKFVYERGEVMLAQLAQVLADNWQGHETLRARIMADPVKYGNHIAEADDLAREIFAFCGRQVIGKPTTTGGVYRMGCDSVDMSDQYGEFCGASADGRLAGQPLSKNLRPVVGMERNGVTAFIQSVCELDHSDFVDGAPLDFIIHPSAVEGQAGLEAMKALIRMYLKKGGFAIQGNILSLEQLLDAQAHPEKHQNLQVRVCGWNEYFVNMSRLVQDDFIHRTAGLEK